MVNILYEDNHVIVAVKPPNMLSQADKTGDVDMLAEVKEYIRKTHNKPGNVYLGLVHRLDRPVGGLMVFAKTSKAASRLSEQMRRHEMGREYLCVAEGTAPATFNRLNYLTQDDRVNRVMVCDADDKGAQRAVLHGECIAAREGVSLCKIRLETGRKHQIRVQMLEMGHPLWGDNRYGHGYAGQQIALWGYRLTFEHPTTHRIMTFQHLPGGSVWNRFSTELTEIATLFEESAEMILTQEREQAEAAAAEKAEKAAKAAKSTKTIKNAKWLPWAKPAEEGEDASPVEEEPAEEPAEEIPFQCPAAYQVPPQNGGKDE